MDDSSPADRDDEGEHGAPLIQPISQGCVHRLVAGQAVTDLSSAVKELVDNAIDAGAGRVCVRLHDQGLEAIEVSDNGSGVPPASRPLMAMKHATSKLRQFDDLYHQDDVLACAPTLGFRGEALFCLANLSRSLAVSTRCRDSDGGDPLGEQFSFDVNGNLIESSRQRSARPIGTAVTVRGLFECLPVRRVDFCKRIRGQRAKLIKMMQGYAILCLGTQFNFSDVPVAKGNKSKGKSKQEVRIIATSESSKTLEARTASILGTKFLSGLTRITIDLSEAAPSAGKVPWQMQGLVSHAPSSPRPATARDLQFFSINGRPVDLPAVSRILGDVWRGFDPASAAGGARRRPACVWAFTLPRSAYDVNLAPDKREVMFTEEATVAELVRLGLTELWSGQCEGQFAANEVEDRSNPAKSRGNDGPSGGAQATDGEGGRGVADKSTSQSNAQEETALAKLGVEHDDTTPKLRKSNTSSPSIGRLVTPTDEEALQDESGSGVTSSTSEKKETSPAKLTTQEMAAACCGRESPQAGGWDRLQLPERARQQDRRGWEQKQLNFQKTERKQLQQDLDSLLFSAKNVVDRGRNNTLVASKTSPAKTALATESVESHMHSKDQKYQNQDVTSFLNKLSSRSTKVVAAAREKAVMRQSAPKGNTLHNERNTRMVIGRTAISDKPQRSLSCEPVAEKANLPSSRSPSKEDKHDNGTVPKRGNDLAPPPDEVEWSAFQGTQDVMAQYKSARVMMHETRQSLRKSAKRKREDADGGAQTAENSAEKSATVNLFKEDFPHMTIIGQFNLGFILALCRNNKLWILDQHACDEIYNFERLCKDTVMHEQKLIAPLPLDLSPSEENCVLENMDIFERNGFRFSYDCDKGPRHRLSLTALPHSGSGGDGVKSVQFGVEDVGALCAMLGADGTSSAEGYMAGFGAGLPAGGKIAGVNAVRRYAGVSQSGTNMGGDVGSSIVRLPKAVGMFANRACRGSIMIGDALSHKEQTAILKNLYTTDNPWSCAHGRPTMSHIRSLAKILMEDDDAMVAHVAGPNLSVIRDD